MVAVAGLPWCGEAFSSGHGHHGSIAAAVSTVAVPTTPLFSKKLSSSSSAASLDASTPEPLPGKLTRAQARKLELSVVPPSTGCAILPPFQERSGSYLRA